ncbi:hypothetical protein TNCV_4040481 [Trichonephila clavipes]|nr:hypothetical protein TNCV_4040481 [Trichonephila clavipes]
MVWKFGFRHRSRRLTLVQIFEILASIHLAASKHDVSKKSNSPSLESAVPVKGVPSNPLTQVTRAAGCSLNAGVEDPRRQTFGHESEMKGSGRWTMRFTNGLLRDVALIIRIMVILRCRLLEGLSGYGSVVVMVTDSSSRRSVSSRPSATEVLPCRRAETRLSRLKVLKYGLCESLERGCRLRRRPCFKTPRSVNNNH